MGDSFVFDQGIILSTGNNTYSFIRYSIWDCAVYLKDKKEAEGFYSVSRVREDLKSVVDADLKISVKREHIVL